MFDKKFLSQLISTLGDDKPTRNSRILVVDSMNTFMRNFSTINAINPAGHHIGGLVGYLRSVGYAIKTFRPTRVILVFDGTGSTQNKKNLYPDYKGNRNISRIMNWDVFDDKEDESDAMAGQMSRLIHYLKQLPVSLISIDKIEADDSILEHTKARLPWLVLALLGGFISVKVLGLFEGAMLLHGNLFFFTPLIAAMAGNVGVQSSAIIVQGLANDSLSGTLFNRLIKEVSLSLLNGIILASILFLGSHFLLNVEVIIGVIVTTALISVIIIASLIGTFIPLLLNKFKIDPALATGPFITTSNDIFGILIYFSIAKLILGF